MSDLETSLQRLASLPAPASLGLIDDAVLAGLAARRRDESLGRRAMGLAGALALLLGLGSAGLTAPHSAQARTISPFAPDNPLAPSTLLDVHP